MKRLEALSNLAVFCVAVLCGIVLIKEHFLAAPPVQPPDLPTPAASFKGNRISLEGVEWDKSESTIVLALSTQCRFCTDSIPFYRKLTAIRRSSGGNFRLLTVFPQTTTAAKAYLQEHNVVADAVFSLSLGEIGASATPTLLLVDSEGIVQDAWVGMLPETGEKEVLAKLKESCKSCSFLSGPSLSPSSGDTGESVILSATSKLGGKL